MNAKESVDAIVFRVCVETKLKENNLHTTYAVSNLDYFPPAPDGEKEEEDYEGVVSVGDESFTTLDQVAEHIVNNYNYLIRDKEVRYRHKDLPGEEFMPVLNVVTWNAPSQNDEEFPEFLLNIREYPRVTCDLYAELTRDELQELMLNVYQRLKNYSSNTKA